MNAIDELLALDHPIALAAGTPHRAAGERLRALTLEQLFAPHAIRDAEAARACLAGLWLRFDWLDESHAVSQSLSTAEGAFWHGIMHRREPDPSNAKYWFRRVGDHPVIPRLVSEAASSGDEYENPSEFVADCERVRGTGTPDEEAAERVQSLEWNLLFRYCFEKAVGAAPA